MPSRFWEKLNTAVEAAELYSSDILITQVTPLWASASCCLRLLRTVARRACCRAWNHDSGGGRASSGVVPRGQRRHPSGDQLAGRPGGGGALRAFHISGWAADLEYRLDVVPPSPLGPSQRGHDCSKRKRPP